MSVSKNALQAMIDDVANDFAEAVILKKAELAKSEKLRKDFPPEKEDESAPAKEASDSAPADADASPAPDAPEAAPAPGPDASASAPAPAPDAGAPAPDAGMADPAAQQQLDPAALQAEYAKLAPDELEMHLQAAMAAKQALAGAAPAPGAADAAPAPAAPAPEMKAEAPAAMKVGDGSGEIEKSAIAMEKSVIAKSEKALTESLRKTEDLEKLVKAQAEEIEALQKGLQKIIDVPGRKAVTTVNHVTREVAPAAKEWTKDTIHAHLKKLSSTGKLAKNDRDLINDFYCGVVKIDKLAHLFEEK